jgi:Phage capsid family
MTKQPHFVPLAAPAARGRPSDHIVRCLVATAIAQFERADADEVCERLYPGDRATALVLRAATAPADTTTSGWASQLATSSIADLVQTLGPANAGGELMRRGIALEFGQSAQINAPAVISAAIGASAWIGQGLPIPARALSVGAGATLVPKKVAAIFAVTRDLLSHSVPNAEKLIRAAATETLGAEIDSAMFDAAASSTTRPAGLRFNVSTVTAASASSDAMQKDLGALAQAVSAVGGMNIAFVAAPGEAVKIALRAGPEFKFPVLASGGLASGFIMAVALPALVSAVDPNVRFDISSQATVHFEDTTPLQLSSGAQGSAVPASPTRSLWQTDAIGFRLVVEVSWGLRAAGAVAWTSAVTW